MASTFPTGDAVSSLSAGVAVEPHLQIRKVPHTPRGAARRCGSRGRWRISTRRSPTGGFARLPAWLEARFQSDTADDQARALFRAALAAALVYCVQLIAESSLTPDAFGFSAALHFGVVTPALLLIAAFAGSAVTPLQRDLMGLRHSDA